MDARSTHLILLQLAHESLQQMRTSAVQGSHPHQHHFKHIILGLKSPGLESTHLGRFPTRPRAQIARDQVIQLCERTARHRLLVDLLQKYLLIILPNATFLWLTRFKG